MKEYFKTDREGRKKVVEQDNGITIELLIEPSEEYLATLPPPSPRPEGVDLNDLKKLIDYAKEQKWI